MDGLNREDNRSFPFCRQQPDPAARLSIGAGFPNGRLAILVSLVAFVLAVCPAQALEAGASKVRLRFPEGTPLEGDAARQGRPALGEHDPLWVRCLYLSDGEVNAYLVTMDLHHVPEHLRDRVVAASEGFAPKESIFLVATGTGNGPGGLESRLPLRWTAGRFRPELRNYLVETVAESMRSAREAAQRATLGVGTGRQQVLSRNVLEEGGAIDGQIGVLRVDDADGRAIAILSNFSALPRMAPEAQHYHFSADYPGAYYNELEALSDPGCVALFLPGACAGQRPGNPENESGWAAVASIGRLLAVQTKSVANNMSFRDVDLQTFYRETPLPPTVATSRFPSSTAIQALNIDGFLLVFLPAFPSVEVGESLRREMKAWGASTSCVVGAANGHLGNILSYGEFSRGGRALSSHYFGPGMADWVRREVRAMLDGVSVEPGRAPEAGGELDDADAAATFVGSGYARGFERGARYAQTIQAHYEDFVLAPVREGLLRPPERVWSYWPHALDPTPVALPGLASSARTRLSGMSSELFAVLDGFAGGAGLPFDANWLLQNVYSLERPANDVAWFGEPLSTAVAIVGERAGAEDVMVGLNLDWPVPEGASVMRSGPATGHAILEIGFGWHLGTLAGMNDAGVTIVVLELSPWRVDDVDGLPVGMLVRDTLLQSADFESAMRYLKQEPAVQKGRLLLSGPATDGWRSAVVDLGSDAATRTAEDGLLFGIEPGRGGASDVTRERYTHLEGALIQERIVGRAELERVLSSGSAQERDRRRVWNANTRFSAILFPGRRTVFVALPGDTGTPEPYESHTLTAGGGNDE